MQSAESIDVISYCSADGDMLPLRIRTTEENGERLRGYIREILSTKENKRLGSESRSYLCRVQLDGRFVVVELKYQVRSHSWQLLRRLY